MSARRIAIVVGTRPEAIKMAPVILEALRHANLTVTLIATGQHDGLFDDAIAGFGIKPDAHLGAAPGAPVETLRKYIARWLAAHRPDIVLVQGDTNSALAGAQAAYGLGIPVGHVEAGLRTHTPLRPFPEENNRVAIAQLAALHFAPSLLAADNLRAENVRGAIHITGNPGIDALMQTTATFSLPPVQTGHHILITCHRREIFGAPLKRIIAATKALAARDDVRMTIPVHPNPAVGDVIRAELANLPCLQLTEPLDYPAMMRSVHASRFVLSDSGGLQEECAALSVPMLCLREETERPELLASGNVRLVGSDTALIFAEAIRLLDDDAYHASIAAPAFPYGRGDAADSIVTILAS